MLHEHTTIEGEPAWHSPPGWAPFSYLPGRLWCDTEELAGEVARYIRDHQAQRGAAWSVARQDRGDTVPDAEPDGARESASSMVERVGDYFRVSFEDGGELDNPVLSVLEAVSTEKRGWFRLVWPEYVASLFEHTNYYPAAPPLPAAPVDYPSDGAPVKVWIVDLGFGSVWASNGPNGRPGGLVTDSAGGAGVAGKYSPATVHGDLVALVAANYAAGKAEIKGKSLLTSDDSVFAIRRITASGFMPLFSVRRMVNALEEVLAEDGAAAPGIVVLASGAYVHPIAPPKDLLGAVGALIDKGWYVVAAAGNDGSASAPVYPAIDTEVLGVEAWEEGQFGFEGVACYSNQHPLHVGGPGKHDVPFPKTVLQLRERPAGPCSPIFMNRIRFFDGGATIRGTSFAAPAVAGLLAANGGPGSGLSARVLLGSLDLPEGFSA